MKLQFFVAVFLNIWALTIPQDFSASAVLKQKRHSPLTRSIKYGRSKPILIKRVPGISPLIPSRNPLRILNNKSPLNLIKNQPYYINHYMYFDNDNIDDHTMDQIKTGSYSNNKDKFHSVGFTGNKEFHVLHLPKNKEYNLDDIKFQLSLLNAHKSPEAPAIDLEINEQLGNFEVNLEDIKPLDLDESHLPTGKPSVFDIVTPLIQGYLPSKPNHNHNNNFIQLADYLNQNGHNGEEHFSELYGNFDNSHHSHASGAILDVPHFEKHPLEHDSSKASYDTPGALDSYGRPASDSFSHISNFNFHPEIPGSFVNGFGNGFKGDDLYQSKEYNTELNEINGSKRRRRMDTSSTTEKTKIEKSQNKEEIKHSNHKNE